MGGGDAYLSRTQRGLHREPAWRVLWNRLCPRVSLIINVFIRFVKKRVEVMSGQPRRRHCQAQECENQMFPTEKSPRKPQMCLIQGERENHWPSIMPRDHKLQITSKQLKHGISWIWPLCSFLTPILENSRISSSEKKPYHGFLPPNWLPNTMFMQVEEKGNFRDRKSVV